MTRSCVRDPDKIAENIDYGSSTGKSLKDQVNGAGEGVVVHDNKVNKSVMSVNENHVLGEESTELQIIDKFGKTTVDDVPTQVGTKRKRNHVDICKGWSMEQELALERAYLTANPTPHFWKKVSRLVIHYN